MNRLIRRLGVALLLCYLVVFVQLNVLQLVRAGEYNENPNNNRETVRDFSRPRGTIQSADGVVLARSVPVDSRFEYQREYPTGVLFGSVVGYFSFLFGSEGLERTYNDELSGTDDDEQVTGLGELFLNRHEVNDLTLTLRADVQEAARAALGEREGAVAAVDPRTGAVLALWNFPTFDSNALSDHDLERAEQVRQFLLAFPGNPLVPAAYRERYFPGSTFKVVTAAAGLESGTVGPRAPVYPPRDAYVPPLTTRPIRNFGGSTCGGDLFAILRVSCNVAFAEMAVDIGADDMVRTAEAFGFNQRPPLDLPATAPSAYPSVDFFDQNTPLLAQTGIGQNEVQATPLQMALVAAAVANGGSIMEPYVVAQVRDQDGRVVRERRPRLWKQAMSQANAAILRDAMIEVVANGTATRLAIPGVTVGGKTGTAQLGTDPPSSHAWIMGFAPAENPRVAVAVIVEGQPGVSEQTGGRVAAPIAKAVIEAVLAAPDPLATPPPTVPSSTSTVPGTGSAPASE